MERTVTGLPAPKLFIEGYYQWDRFVFRPAPNRYRRMEGAEVCDTMKKDFVVPGYEPIGREISPFDWDEILVWECPHLIDA